MYSPKVILYINGEEGWFRKSVIPEWLLHDPWFTVLSLERNGEKLQKLAEAVISYLRSLRANT